MFSLLVSAFFLSSNPLLSDLRFYDAFENNGNEYIRIEGRANEFTLGKQHNATLAYLPDGRFAIAWESQRQLRGKPGVFVRVFDKFGKPIISESRVSRNEEFPEIQPSCLLTSNGKVSAFYQSPYRDGSLSGIYLGDKQTNVRFLGEQFDVVSASSHDKRVAVYVSEISGKETRIFARVFDKNDKPITNEFQISNVGKGRDVKPAVALSGNEGIVVWQRFDENGDLAGIYAQRFSLTGKRIGTPKCIGGESAVEPVICTAGKSYIVAWMESKSNGDFRVRAIKLNDDLSANGFIPLSESPNHQNGVALAGRPDGSFVIGWNEWKGEDVDVYLQSFDTYGKPTSPPFYATKNREGEQKLAEATGRQRIAYLRDGSIVIAWSGHGDLDDSNGVYYTCLLPSRSISLDIRKQLGEVNTSTKNSLEKILAARESSSKTEEIRVVTEQAIPHEPPKYNPRFREDPWKDYSWMNRSGGFVGILNTGWTPPDPHLAAGPNHIAVMTNGAIAWFTKDGTKQFQDEIEASYGFWGSLGTGSFVFDPEVIYDPHSGRFMAMACERTNGKSYFLLAVSDDSDPNGSWYKYRFDVTSLAGGDIDSPNIAVDTQAVYLTADFFTPNQKYLIYILKKSDVLVGNTPLTKNLLITGQQSHGIPITWDADAPAQYMIEHFESSTNTTVRLHAIQDPLGSPTRTTYTLSVPAYGPPEDLPQKGSSVKQETFDSRFWSCVYRNGSLWATHHVNSTRVRARWYEIKMNGWPVSGNLPTLVQSGEADPGDPIRTAFTSISVDAVGNAGLVCARGAPGSTGEYLSMMIASRRATDPLGTMPNMEIVKSSTSAYTLYGRWGDYSACVTDPVDNKTFWGHHEWAEGNNWRTWIQPFAPPGTEQELAIEQIIPIKSGNITGGIAEIAASDDSYLVIPPGILSRGSPLASEVDYITTSPTDNVVNLGLRIEGKANMVSSIDVFVLNRKTGIYDHVSNGTLLLLDGVLGIPSIANPKDYIDPTTKEIRVRVDVSTLISTRSGPTVSMDEVKVLVTY